jgi:ribonuclease D
LISSEKIIKVFHDCLEDISLLNSYGNLSKFNSIFDTQIAHRICFNAENNCNSIGTKNISISLKELLKYYFNIKPELKDEIHDLMSKKPYLWKNRPLTEKLIYYAGCDVKYLPKIFDIICKKCDKVIEFSEDMLEGLEQKIAETCNFNIIDHQVLFYGYCQECAKKLEN